ncbi:hypothetical protein PhCBS80983_g00992 [Powellomyces hirtus]|uniref:Mannose-P-dolichol utilization defect 1 protein homolog n=1 Tax=Powellomyces hirtus TaxID=109895 RepID=A0A507EDD7_9FUNG|nr:hypothetical protein PhCBS80983_g00992 [Powellomyces hirtus]
MPAVNTNTPRLQNTRQLLRAKVVANETVITEPFVLKPPASTSPTAPFGPKPLPPQAARESKPTAGGRSIRSIHSTTETLARMTQDVEPPTLLATMLGPSCATLDASPQCKVLLTSKLIGMAILVLGSLLKLPSLFPVLKAGSTRGIPIPPLLFETFGFTVGIAFNIRHANPFTTWGEAPCLLVANLLILLVHWKHRPLLVIASAAAYSYAFRTLLSPLRSSDATLQMLLGLTVPAFMTGTVLQIYENHREKHIGGISPATLTMGLMCGLGRLLTTFVEVDDPVVRFSAVFGAFLGLVLFFQMIVYKDGTRRFLEHASKAK